MTQEGKIGGWHSFCKDVLQGGDMAGMRNGTGTQFSSLGLVWYQGGFSDGHYDGEGVLYNLEPDTASYLSTLGRDETLTDLGEIGGHWTKFQGSFVNGQKSGPGKLILDNADSITGVWENDKLTGTACYRRNTGVSTIGVWCQDK